MEINKKENLVDYILEEFVKRSLSIKDLNFDVDILIEVLYKYCNLGTITIFNNFNLILNHIFSLCRNRESLKLYDLINLIYFKKPLIFKLLTVKNLFYLCIVDTNSFDDLINFVIDDEIIIFLIKNKKYNYLKRSLNNKLINLNEKLIAECFLIDDENEIIEIFKLNKSLDINEKIILRLLINNYNKNKIKKILEFFEENYEFDITDKQKKYLNKEFSLNIKLEKTPPPQYIYKEFYNKMIENDLEIYDNSDIKTHIIENLEVNKDNFIKLINEEYKGNKNILNNNYLKIKNILLNYLLNNNLILKNNNKLYFTFDEFLKSIYPQFNSYFDKDIELKKIEILTVSFFTFS